MANEAPSVVSLNIDTAIKFWVFASSLETLGVEEGNDDMWFLARDCASQIMEAIRNQAGDEAVAHAQRLLARANA